MHFAVKFPSQGNIYENVSLTRNDDSDGNVEIALFMLTQERVGSDIADDVKITELLDLRNLVSLLSSVRPSRASRLLTFYCSSWHATSATSH